MSSPKKVDLLDVAIIFAQRKKQLISIIVSITIIGTIIAFVFPKSYKSSLSYVVNSSNSLNLSSGGLLSGLANLSVANKEMTSDQILFILRSDLLIDELIKEFDLGEVYGDEIQEALRKKLNANISIEDFREGGIGLNSIIATKVSVIDESPMRAFKMNEFYFAKLDSIVELLNKSNIETGYSMLENRLDKNLFDLKEAEESLKSFQLENGILEIEEQTKALIQNSSVLKAELVSLEIQIEASKTFFSQDNSEIKALETRKKFVEEMYQKSLSEESGETGFDIYKPLDQLPSLYIEYLRKFRELEVQQEIYKILYPQYEQQKLNYEEVSSGLTLIDPPGLPTYKNGPKRAYIMIASFLLGCFVAIISVFFSSWKESAKSENNDTYHKYREFINSLKV